MNPLFSVFGRLRQEGHERLKGQISWLTGTTIRRLFERQVIATSTSLRQLSNTTGSGYL